MGTDGIEVKVAELCQKVVSIEKYIEEDKETKKEVQSLVVAVKELSVNVNHMVKAQSKTEAIVQRILDEPNQMVAHAKKQIVAGVASALATAILMLIVMGVTNKPF